MSKACENTALIQRDGTSRRQRLLDALLPGYVSVDERSMKDLIRFVQQFAEEVRFYDSDNTTTDNWKAFFDSDPDLDILLNEERGDEENFLEYVKVKSGYTQPHIALFLAFLKLFDIAREDLNLITKKHLDYYYKEVLQLQQHEAVADQVFAIFNLAQHIDDSHLIKKGTVLSAGKDATGQNLYYKTDRDLVVNHGEVDAIKALYVDRDSNYRLYASPVANSMDGEGAEVETDEMSWKTFGGPDRKQADVGFCIASPLLYLAEGLRTIELTLHFEPGKVTAEALRKLATGDVPFAKDVFRVQFSGKEEWIAPQDEHIMNEDEMLHSDIARGILYFVNTETAEGISEKVKDDPDKGYAKVRPGYGIGIVVAGRIISMREDKGKFTKVEQLRKVRGLGPDKIHDLIYTIRRRLHKSIHSTKVRPDEYTLTIVRTLKETQPAVVSYNRKVLDDPVNTQWPVMKVLLNKEHPDPAFEDTIITYKHLKDLNIEQVDLNVDVSGIKNNTIQNDAGPLDPGKPFQPFGNRPVVGSSFYIGNWEIFQKRLDKLWVNINWHDLPENQSFGEYYRNYTMSRSDRDNGSFRTDIAILDKRTWNPVKTQAKLFDYKDTDSPVNRERTLFVHHGEGLDRFERDPEMKQVDVWNRSTQKGFIRLTLEGTDFGHKDFTPSYTAQVMKEVQNGTSEPDNLNTGNSGNTTSQNEPEGPALPLEPYTPTIGLLSLDYRSSVEMNLVNQPLVPREKRKEQYFQVYPFGMNEVMPDQKNNRFLPLLVQEGSLYIGLKNIRPGRNISLLFQVSEGSADPDAPSRPEVVWSYLAGSKWTAFDERHILTDSTNNLLTSGIISFSIPKDATLDHSELPENRIWLRATVENATPAVSDMVDIRAQAVTVTFSDNNNDPNHLAEPLAPDTIDKLRESDSAIKEVIQPYSSFGGALREESGAFYTRVSERLRHKRRAVSIWDYERLVLQQFPSIYKVKCLNHTIYKGRLKGYREIAPGNVSLIVVSEMINKTAMDPLKPKTSLITLEEVHAYLEEINADDVQLHVHNPLYEEVQAEFNVKFTEGTDAGHFQKVLNDEIVSFLSPWVSREVPDVVFGGRIHKSMILNFIKNRDYVDFVTCFKMYHEIPGSDNDKKAVKEAEASTSASVLGSAPEHKIHVLDAEECRCDDNEVEAFREFSTDNCG